jgi:ribose 5-phosphate isomerase B
MRLAIGADHAGFHLKEHLKVFLEAEGHQLEDLGTHSDAPTDYPPICAAVARAVRDGRAERGIVLGGSGQGEQIAANKVRGIRAAVCNDTWMAEKSRSHNDANVIAMGARVVAPDLAEEILKTWLEQGFEGGRHDQRVRQIEQIEKEETGGGA